jgi:hypothetical protein
MEARAGSTTQPQAVGSDSSPTGQWDERPQQSRVLIVDDEPMIGRLVGRLLRTRYAVEAVTSAGEALARIRDGERYDLILCDLLMPAMTGKELYDELSQSAPDAARRMVFLSGGACHDWMFDFLNSVKNPQIDKPFAPATFPDRIADLLDAVGVIER